MLVQREPSTFCLESTPGEPEKWIIPNRELREGGVLSSQTPCRDFLTHLLALLLPCRGRRSHAGPHPHPRDKEAEQRRLFARGGQQEAIYGNEKQANRRGKELFGGDAPDGNTKSACLLLGFHRLFISRTSAEPVSPGNRIRTMGVAG